MPEPVRDTPLSGEVTAGRAPRGKISGLLGEINMKKGSGE